MLAAGLLYLGYLVRATLMPFLLAAAFAFMLEPPVRFLEARGLSRLAAILITYTAVGGLVAGFLLYFIPVLVGQLTLLSASLPALTYRAGEIVTGLQETYLRAGIPDEVRQVIDRALGTAESRLLGFIEGVLSSLFGAVSGLLTVILAPFLAFYLLRDREVIRNGIMAALPTATRGETGRVIVEMSRVFAGFIQGQVTVALIVGVMVGVATEFLGLRFSAVLGVVAGVTNIIPYFGPVIGAVPAVVLALLRDPVLALKTVAAFFVIQQIDSLLITPRVVGGSVGLHPLVVIFSLLAGAQLFGVLGMLLAVPVVAVSRVLLRYIFLKLVADWGS